MNLILTGILAFAAWTSAAELEIFCEWKYIDYVWPNYFWKKDAISAGIYHPATLIPNDLQPIGGRVFLATPRISNNPASLSTISNQIGDGGPLLEPYPSWDWHTSEDCSGITSVSRIATDDCDRLWIVDSGKIGTKQMCDAQIMVFDTKTDELLIRETIPFNLTHHSTNSKRGRVELHIVETKGNSCEPITVIIGDPEGNGMVIWNGVNMWRVENDEIFSPNFTQATRSQLPKFYTDNYGISNVLTTPSSFLGEPYVTFNPLLSNDWFAVKLSELLSINGEMTWLKSFNYTSGTNPVISRIISKSGILMGGKAYSQAVTCWNIRYPVSHAYAVDPTPNPWKEYTIATKVSGGCDGASDFYAEKYWQITSRKTKFNLHIVDTDEVNFVVSHGNVGSLIEGTLCDLRSTTSPDRTIEDALLQPYEGSVTRRIF